MSSRDTIADEFACRNLIGRYCHYIDFGEASRVAELFTADGIWEDGRTTLDGIEAIRRGFAARESRSDRISRHVCSTTALEFETAESASCGSRAHGITYLTLYRHDGPTEGRSAPLRGPLLVGEYHDDFDLTSEGWRIRHRRFSVAFAAVKSGTREPTDASRSDSS